MTTKKYKPKELTLLTLEELKEALVPAPKNLDLVELSVTFPYNLRTGPKDKQKDCSIWHQCTAFVNNAGTLVHVVNPDLPDSLIRLVFKTSIKHLSLDYMREVIYARCKLGNIR